MQDGTYMDIRNRAINPKTTTLKQLNRAERTQHALTAWRMSLNDFPVASDSKLPIRNLPSKPLDHQRLFWYETELRAVYENFDCNIAIKLGETSLNAFVIDIDNPGRGIVAMTRLAAHGIRTLIIKTPKRGYHLYFRCADCAVAGADLMSNGIKYGDLKGQGGYTLFSGSTVNGKPYSFVDGSEPYTDTLQNLQNLLTDILGETIVLKPTTYGRGIWHDLPAGGVVHRSGRWVAMYCEYLNTPTPEGNRKNKLYKNTLYSIATGRPLEAVESAAQRDGLPQSEIERTIAAAAQRDHVLGHTPIGGQSWHWHAAMQFVDTYREWSTGQQGNTERAVMGALIERARMDATERGVFRASIREIKQLSQKSYTPAVNSALQRLIDKGLLIRVSGSRQRGLQDCAVAQPVNGRYAPTKDSSSVSQKLQASRWRFADVVLQDLHSRELRSQETDVSTVYVTQQIEFMRDTRRSELLERGSLGQTAVRVHGYLMANNGAPSQTVIAAALGVNRATVCRALNKMLGDDYKLVEYIADDKRWYAVPMADDEWADLAQQQVNARGKNRYEQRKARFGKERHENLLGIYLKLLEPYQKRLEWHEQQELASDPLLAEAFSLGAKVEEIA